MFMFGLLIRCVLPLSYGLGCFETSPNIQACYEHVPYRDVEELYSWFLRGGQPWHACKGHLWIMTVLRAFIPYWQKEQITRSNTDPHKIKGVEKRQTFQICDLSHLFQPGSKSPHSLLSFPRFIGGSGASMICQADNTPMSSLSSPLLLSPPFPSPDLSSSLSTSVPMPTSSLSVVTLYYLHSLLLWQNARQNQLKDDLGSGVKDTVHHNREGVVLRGRRHCSHCVYRQEMRKWFRWLALVFF